MAGGAALAVVGVGYSLKKLPWDRIMNVGILSAAFFVASLVHVPLGPGNVHLIMNGLMGALLGWSALPAIAVALFLQALLFQYGGFTSLGVNICLMAFPAVFCGLFFRRFFALPGWRAQAAFACGAFAVLGSGLLCSLALALSGEVFFTTAWAILAAHVPIMLVEGFLTMIIVGYLARALPDVLRKFCF